MHKVMEFQGHTKPILKFEAFGDFIFSLAEEGEFIVFDRLKGNVIKKMNFDSHFEGFIHPRTYVNKLVFYGGESTELWNIMDEKKIFTFNLEGTVSVIEQSPVVDVVAVGFEDGTIVLLNLLYNKVILKFSQK